MWAARGELAGTAGLGPSTVVAFDTRTGALVRTYTIQGEDLSQAHSLTNMAFDARHRLYVLSSQLGLLRIVLGTGAQEVYAPPIPDLPRCAAVPAGTPCSPTATDAAPEGSWTGVRQAADALRGLAPAGASWWEIVKNMVEDLGFEPRISWSQARRVNPFP